MKKILLITLALIMTVMFCSCGTADSFVPSGFKKISADNVGYKLYVPTNWIEDISTGVTAAYYSANDRSNISFMAFEVDDTIIQGSIVSGADESSETSSVTSSPADTTAADTSSENSSASDTSSADTTAEDSPSEVPEIESVEEYWEYYSADFEKTFSDMKYETEGENMLLSTKKAKKYVYTATVTGAEYKFMQVVMLNAGTVYIFTYTATPEKYSEHIEEVEEIIGHISVDF